MEAWRAHSFPGTDVWEPAGHTHEALGLQRTALRSLIRTRTWESAQSCLLPRLLATNPSFLLLHDHIRWEKARRPLGRSSGHVLLAAWLFCSVSRTLHPGSLFLGWSPLQATSSCCCPCFSRRARPQGGALTQGHLRTSAVDFSRNMSFLFPALSGVENLKLSL